jgi:glutamate synthase (NADPH/NADH) large chain
MLHMPELPDGAARHQRVPQQHGLEHALDHTLMQLAEGAIAYGDRVRLELPVRNVNRAVGTMLGNAVTKRWNGDGLPDGTIDVTFTGSAGQSFAAFLPRGIMLRLLGDANDYVGKGLSGGRIVVRPHADAPFAAEDHVVAGNVVLYGATSGEAYVRGLVGERFCVRNSGATAVVEGIGDHGCEYMTGGVAVILGPTGRNFAAGMSGGVAYVLDLRERRVNHAMVDLDPLDATDGERLRYLVSQHRTLTASAVAERLLLDWDSAVNRFTKVMPKDYKRVLAARLEAERQGLSEEDAALYTMAAARG